MLYGPLHYLYGIWRCYLCWFCFYVLVCSFYTRNTFSLVPINVTLSTIYMILCTCIKKGKLVIGIIMQGQKCTRDLHCRNCEAYRVVTATLIVMVMIILYIFYFLWNFHPEQQTQIDSLQPKLAATILCISFFIVTYILLRYYSSFPYVLRTSVCIWVS